jgi:hypothetical protein
MIIKDYVKQSDGFSKFEVLATEEETGVLINIAVNMLIDVGRVPLEELEESQTYDIDLAELQESDFFRA